MISKLEERDGKEVVVHYGSDLEPFAWHTPLGKHLHCSICADGAKIIAAQPDGSYKTIRHVPGIGWEAWDGDAP